MQKVNRRDLASTDFAQSIISYPSDDLDINAVRFERVEDVRHQGTVSGVEMVLQIPPGLLPF